MDGVVVVLKPPGMSSNDVVVDIRRLFDLKRVGHTGTLDPAASGVLPVCVGRATRLFDYLVDKRKKYIYEICFGASTDTQDATGRVCESSDGVVTREMVESLLPKLRGRVMQTVPMYSALKYNGQKLYDIALAGKSAPEKRREIDLFSHELIETTGRNRFLLRVECSRGTYVRTLCDDMGRYAGVPAHMSFLLRESSGDFDLDEAYSIAELAEMKESGSLISSLISCEHALSSLPKIVLGDDRLTPTKNGLGTTVRADDGAYRCYACGSFLGVARVNENNLKLEVHLY
ncbi:MAG TPA: tRNA pseudouridine(55) synthase TruB [Clostridia bacterium]|nr:tRNA pseudouridine(55) synthase TruB [Clostridia bacterium]